MADRGTFSMNSCFLNLSLNTWSGLPYNRDVDKLQIAIIDGGMDLTFLRKSFNIFNVLNPML